MLNQVIFDFVTHHRLQGSNKHLEIIGDQWNKSLENDVFDSTFETWKDGDKIQKLNDVPKDLQNVKTSGLFNFEEILNKGEHFYKVQERNMMNKTISAPP